MVEEVTQTNIWLDTSTGEEVQHAYFDPVLGFGARHARLSHVYLLPQRAPMSDGTDWVISVCRAGMFLSERESSPQFQREGNTDTDTDTDADHLPSSLVLITITPHSLSHTPSTHPLHTMMSFAQVAKRSAGKTLRQHAIAKRCT